MTWRSGKILVRVKEHSSEHVPSHLDVVQGVLSKAASVDGGGQIDQTLKRHAGAFECSCPYHAAASLGHVGHRHHHYNEQEHRLGLSRTVCVRIAKTDDEFSLVQDLRSLANVEWAGYETLAVAPLNHTHSQLSVTDVLGPHVQVGVAEAHGMMQGIPSTPIAVIDTGVALGHQELKGRIGFGFDTVDLGSGTLSENVILVGDSSGHDFSADDLTGHGSHVAGIIAAIGIYLPPGVSSGSTVVPVRSLAAAHSGDGRLFGVGGLSDIDAGIKVAVDLGAKVLNMSFGTPADVVDSNMPKPHEEVIAYAREKGAIAVAAMGNSGKEEAYYPAALADVISVGSVNAQGQPSEFSTRGPHIDLSAPGEDVISMGMSAYKSSTGTSHATPFVTGAVSLMMARARSQGWSLTVDIAKDLLHTSTQQQPPSGFTHAIGFGVLNVPAALRRVDEFATSGRMP